MPTGRQNKLTCQTGEYIVAAELSRRGFIATTFTGNVPHYDIVASNEEGMHVSVQVKAIRGKTWQFSLSQFCDVAFRGSRQMMGSPKECPVQRLVCVLVKLNEYGSDVFYVLPWVALRDLVIQGHKAWLSKHGGVRPKNWKFLHTALPEAPLQKYKDSWNLIEKNLK